MRFWTGSGTGDGLRRDKNMRENGGEEEKNGEIGRVIEHSCGIVLIIFEI